MNRTRIFPRLWPFIIILPFLFLLASSPLQSVTPTPPAPTPTETPVPPVPPDLQDEYNWFIAALPKFGWWLIPIVLLVIIFILFRTRIQGWLDAWKEGGKRDLERIKAKTELDLQEHDYLEYVSSAYKRFKFRGLPRTSGEGIQPPELDQAYISVNIVTETKREMRLTAQNKEGMDLDDKLELESAHPIELAEAIQKSPKLAVTGVAGSGKSTLLQWAGLACARLCLGEKLTQEQESFMKALGGKSLLPILISLRAYNEH